VNSSNLAHVLHQPPGDEEIVEYAIDIKDLCKSFKRHTRVKGGYTTIKSKIIETIFGRAKTFGSSTHAISDFTVRIPKGLSVGIIGRNGSGKSTLLKLITGIYKPTSGSISVNGRVAALIELGAGFHPDFTGRENLELGAVMHGLSRKEINERFDDIVRFAELEAVIDDPVKTYSSGMFMRLGFSLAIHTNPDVLLVDEVLAVGDASFVSKCKDKLSDLRREGKTLLLVTHDLDAVERWCDEVVWIEKGIVKDRGEPRRVIDHYRQFIEKGEEALLIEAQKSTPECLEERDNLDNTSENTDAPQRWGSREVEIKSVSIKSSEGKENLLFHPNDSLIIEIEYKKNQVIGDVVFGIGITRSDGLVVHGTNTDIERIETRLQNQGIVRYHIERLGLLEGKYFLDVAVHRKDGYPYDYHKNILSFAIRSEFKQVGVIEPKHHWEFGVLC
jgi:lipopolysaccharide transport system ATP-binding protein